jgi:hypothetical protein
VRADADHSHALLLTVFSNDEFPDTHEPRPSLQSKAGETSVLSPAIHLGTRSGDWSADKRVPHVPAIPVSPYFFQAGNGLARFHQGGFPKICHKFLPPLGNPSWQEPCRIPATV